MNKLTSILLIFLFFFLQCSLVHKPSPSKVDFITVDEEIQLGEVLQDQMLTQFEIIRNSRINEYFNLMATQISLASEWQDLPYQVYIINQPEAYTFALPGGKIYIYRGLLENLDNHEECAALLALQVAHINLRHATEKASQQYGYNIAAQRVMGENPQIAKHIIDNLFTMNSILNFPPDFDTLADKFAAQYLSNAGYNPQSLSTFLQRVEKLSGKMTGCPQFLQVNSTRLRTVQQITKKTAYHPQNSIFLADFPQILALLFNIPR